MPSPFLRPWIVLLPEVDRDRNLASIFNIQGASVVFRSDRSRPSVPPKRVIDTAGGHFIFRGKRVEAGFDFGLGFAHFSFCFTKAMGEPERRHFRSERLNRCMFNLYV